MKLSRLAIAIAALPLAAFAQSAVNYDQALKLPDTVITANRSVQVTSESVAAITVFNRDDIERLQAVNLADLLSRVPGVQVVQSGGRGSATSVMIRGASNAQSLVLIDGVRVGSASTGGANLQHLNLEQVERVEVLRGTRSAIYGADAIGGVVQIFTRRGSEGLHARARIAAGNKGLWERSLGLAGGNQQTTFNLSASLDEMSGFDRTHASFPSDNDHDAYRNKAFSFSLAHAVNDQLRLGINLLEQHGSTEYDNPFGRYDTTTWTAVPAALYAKFVLSSVSAFAEFNASEQWASRLEVGHSEDKESNYDKLFAGSDSYNTYRDHATWLNTLTLNDQHSLLVGMEYVNDKLHSSTLYSKTNRWNRAAFVQHQFTSDAFSTEIGIRHDHNQQFGHENTWNAGLTLPVNELNSVTLSYAEGFRAPTFNDLYSPASWGGNPHLKAETSKSYELQLRSQLTDEMRLEASVYRTQIRDLITYQSDPITWVGAMENVDKARINGFEASLQHQVYGWEGALGLSIIDPRDRSSGKQLARRAKRTLSYDLDKQWGALGLGGTLRLASSSFNDAANAQKIAGYGTFDLRGSWQASDELGLDLRLSNLFDKGYTRAMYSYQGKSYGYREDPLTVRLGLTWTPNL